MKIYVFCIEVGLRIIMRRDFRKCYEKWKARYALQKHDEMLPALEFLFLRQGLL